ncbi:hypothetical protein ACE1B6_03410 [Aerosakkonemataceae cyanobacterium BLCC-F154]|uniref:Uncharacterized protein n=1 Tax=Floridaenema fluviatile BLCC-F154 TaxID=3153640 RepID=A0ABV4Y6B5_9CYAN
MNEITIVESNSTAGTIALSLNNKTEQYSVNSLPAITSQLVLESCQDILGELYFDSLVWNLTNAADFIFLAYNALAETAVQAKISRLQKSLLDISGDCVTTLDIFGIQSQEVGKTLIKIYGLLLARKEKLAKIQFKYCGQIAQDMADAAQKLAQQIEELCSQSQLVNEDAINIKNLTIAEKSDLIEKLKEFESKEAAAKVLRDDLEKSLANLTREYYASVAKLQDGWFIGAVKTVANACGIVVRDPKEEALRETHTTYNRKSQEYRQEMTKNLNDIKLYAYEISKAQSAISDAARGVKTFEYAVRALSIIVAALKRTTLFWRSIQIYCEQLENSGFASSFEDIQKNSLSEQQIIEEYTNDKFMLLFVKNLSEWVALNTVSHEYKIAAKNTYDKISSNIASAPSIETAKRQTPVLAQQLFDSYEKQEKALAAAAQKEQKWGSFLAMVEARAPVQ